MPQLDLFDQPVPPLITRLTFAQAMRLFVLIYWGKKKMHLKTNSFEKYLLQYFDGRFIDEIGRQDVENMRRWVSTPGRCHRKDRLGISGVNKCHMILSLLFSKLEAWKEDRWAGGYDFAQLALPRRNPGLLVRKQKEPTGTRYITPWEFRRLHKLCRNLGDLELADMIRFGIWARLSPIDIDNLNDDEINESRFQVEIQRRHTITDSNPLGCLQVIPLTEKMWALLNRYRQFRSPGNKRIFSAKNIRRRIARLRRLAVAAGIEDFTRRDLRRSGSGFLHQEGVDIETNADGMGHTTTRMLRAGHYIPRTRPRLKKLSRLLSEAF